MGAEGAGTATKRKTQRLRQKARDVLRGDGAGGRRLERGVSDMLECGTDRLNVLLATGQRPERKPAGRRQVGRNPLAAAGTDQIAWLKCWLQRTLTDHFACSSDTDRKSTRLNSSHLGISYA